MDENVVAYYIA